MASERLFKNPYLNWHQKMSRNAVFLAMETVFIKEIFYEREGYIKVRRVDHYKSLQHVSMHILTVANK